MNHAILLAILALTPAGDEKKWAEAMATWQRLSGSKNAADRTRAVEDLGNATFDKKDKMAAGMILQMLQTELNRSAGGKKEEAANGEVLEACVAALKKVTSPEAVELLLKTAKGKGDPRERLYVVWALGGIAGENVEKALVELLDDKPPQPLVQVGAVDALKERGAKVVDVYLRLLKEENRSWEVKLGAIQALEKCVKYDEKEKKVAAEDEKIVEDMIEALGKAKADEGRLKDEYIRILGKFVGVELKSADANAWKSAWAAKKAGTEPGKDGGTVAEPTEFFGLKTKSTRIVFVLDQTGSMSAPLSYKTEDKPDKKPPTASGAGGAKETPQEAGARAEVEKIKEKYDKKEAKTRMDVLKKEFINTIYYLDPKVYFTVIWYEANQKPWKEQLVPATWANKLDIVRDTDKLNPSGGTNIWGAIECAYKLIEQPQRPDLVALDKKGNYATVINGADTFFLMTDGAHNTGKFVRENAKSSDACDVQAFIAELKKVNRLRKVIINTVCLGSEANGGDRPDATLMKAIADETGGAFMHIKG